MEVLRRRHFDGIHCGATVDRLFGDTRKARVNLQINQKNKRRD